MKLELSVLLMGIADTMDSDKFGGSFNKVALGISIEGVLGFCSVTSGGGQPCRA